MSDLFGHQPMRQEFTDIRNQRPTTAEEKATLCLQLKDLCQRCPPSVVSGSVQTTRQWLADQKKSLKVLNSSRSSVNELTTTIQAMRRYL